MAGIVCYLISPYAGANENMFIVIWCIESFVKPWSEKLYKILFSLYFASFAHCGYTMIGQIYGFVYLTLRVVIQNYILIELIENINLPMLNRDTNVDILMDEIYQNEVYKRLIYCIQMHQKIARYFLVLTKYDL